MAQRQSKRLCSVMLGVFKTFDDDLRTVLSDIVPPSSPVQQPSQQTNKEPAINTIPGAISDVGTSTSPYIKMRFGSLFKPSSFRPLDNHVTYAMYGDQLSQLSHLTSATFPEPHGRINLQKVIGVGKYGCIFMGRSLESAPMNCNNSYAVKCMINEISFSLELAAYAQMKKYSKVCGSSPANCQLNSYCCPTGSRETQHSFAGDFHPLIANLLNHSDKRISLPLANNHPRFTRSSLRQPVGCAFLPRWNCTSSKVVSFHQSIKVHFLLFTRAVGGDLAALTTRSLNRPMRLSEAIFYVAEITEALIWLHRRGIVHQDLKLDNVLIHAHGHVVLTDFGLACVPPNGPGTSFTGNLVCTSRHMPPEVATRQVGTTRIWHAVDWYSLGVLFYRLLCHGDPPPVPQSIALHNILAHLPQLADIPKTCKSMLSQLLAPNPHNRLGGDFINGGIMVLLHPGFTVGLLGLQDYKPSEHGYAFHCDAATGNMLDYGLKMDMLNNLSGTAVDRTRGPNDHRVTGRCQSICVPFANSEKGNPQWIGRLRQAIRNHRLIPPFQPSF